jgi:hypothetical protein
MPLRNVTFATWVRSHQNKHVKERWLRELYPWPVLARVECHDKHVGEDQTIIFDGVEYHAKLRSVQWQPQHGTFRYRVTVESEGLGWNARAWNDDFDLVGTPDGAFVTLFHAKREEPLERIARAFFARHWKDLKAETLRTLAVSRFLSASIVAQVAEQAFGDLKLEHYPAAGILKDSSPMFASGSDLWFGYRFFSEDAYAWARGSSSKASRVIALYFADTKYQFKTELPRNAHVQSITQLDSDELGGRYRDLIIALLRMLENPSDILAGSQLDSIVLGKTRVQKTTITEADVNESLAALKSPCDSKKELRYQLAAGVVVNAWIEVERSLGFRQRKRFYAFKQRIAVLAKWAAETKLPGVKVWSETLYNDPTPILYIRIDDVDFSFKAIASVDFPDSSFEKQTWSGVQLKPIAPIVLAWSRRLLSRDDTSVS